MSEWLLSKRQQITSVGEGVSVSAATREIEERFLKKLKIELLYDPAIPLLSIYLKKKKQKLSYFRVTRTRTQLHAFLIFETYFHEPTSLCSLQHYLQELRYGSNLSSHQQMNG